MADELKPCPFCGHEPKLLKDDYGAHLPDEYPEGGRTWIVCANRHCTSGHKFNTEGSAITAWNTRAQAPSTIGADEREEIARIIDHEGYWERLDSCNHALATVSMTDDQRRALTAVRDDELRGTASSLAKADAILARQGPGPGEAVAKFDAELAAEIIATIEANPSGRFSARQKIEFVQESLAATPTREG